MRTQGIFRSKIAGIGSYLPEKRLTNFDLEKLVDTNNEWIVNRTGIHSRHIASGDQATSDLSLIAAQRAMAKANVAAQDLEMILVATVSPDHIMPNTACILQAKLGAGNCMAVDISAACSGFVYGLSIADLYVTTGKYKTVLVIGAEVLHPYVNYKDRETCILFGDGAGAAIITRSNEGEPSELISSHCHADGQISDLFMLPAGGSKIPFSQHVLDNDLQFVKMKGREIFKNAVRTMSLSCEEALRANNMTGADVDWLIPHQANARIVEAVAKHFGIPMTKVILEIADMGNTSAATIPAAFDIAIQDGRIKRGDTILLTAFGAGITSGSFLLRY